mmetsp:Transcript_1087/g.1566  ORF Transcript_1087/g.1566 Transcript_1087/m.1566 type:complete len:94 (+) Transcript_1087:2499-2780(+)
MRNLCLKATVNDRTPAKLYIVFGEFYPDHDGGQSGFCERKESVWKEMINPRFFHFAEKVNRTRFKVGTYSGFLRFDGGCPWVKFYVLCLSSLI